VAGILMFTTGSGTPQIAEIRLGGATTRLVFGE
jgi:hypothetical protein